MSIATAYFSRQGIARPLRSVRGDVIHFTDIGDDTGILTTNNPVIISELRGLIIQQKFGLSEVTLDQFEAQKKRASAGQKRLDSLLGSALQKPRIERLDQPVKSAAVGSSLLDPSTQRVDNGSVGTPLEVPSEIPLPVKAGKATKPEPKKGKKVPE
jgi:hypothetical protein